MKNFQTLDLTLIAILSIFFYGCSGSENKAPANLTSEKGHSDSTQINSYVQFNTPVVLDMTDYVMYPLPLHKEDSRLGYIKSSYDGVRATYWNIAFYNTATKSYHLLDENRKMIITSYDINNEGSVYAKAEEINSLRKDDIIFYSIITDDYNKDGKLDLDDPGYLFISDKKGNNLRQISPANMYVNSWKVIKGTTKVLIEATADKNNDNKFDQEDESTPYAYDIKAGGIATPVFDKSFTKTISKLFEKQWPAKK
jgi:hypothetical protein